MCEYQALGCCCFLPKTLQGGNAWINIASAIFLTGFSHSQKTKQQWEDPSRGLSKSIVTGVWETKIWAEKIDKVFTLPHLSWSSCFWSELDLFSFLSLFDKWQFSRSSCDRIGAIDNLTNNFPPWSVDPQFFGIVIKHTLLGRAAFDLIVFSFQVWTDKELSSNQHSSR